MATLGFTLLFLSLIVLIPLRCGKQLRSWIKRLQQELKITTLFVTHDQDEALEIADRVVIMNNARIEQIGTPAEVNDEPATPFAWEFLHGHMAANVLSPK